MTGKIIYKNSYKPKIIRRQYPTVIEMQNDIEDILGQPLTPENATKIQAFIQLMTRFLYLETKINWPLEIVLMSLESDDFLEVTYTISIYDLRATLKKLISLPDNEIRLKIIQSGRFVEFQTFIRQALSKIYKEQKIGGFSSVMYDFTPTELRHICTCALNDIQNEKNGNCEKTYYDFFFTMIFKLWTDLGQTNIAIHDSSNTGGHSALVRFSHLLAQKIENRPFHVSNIRKKLTDYRKFLLNPVLGDL